MSALDLSPIDDKIENYLKENDAVKEKRLVFPKGFGLADDTARMKANPEYLFRLTSVSKLFTSIAIMKLA